MITRFLWQGMDRNLRLFVLLILAVGISLPLANLILAATNPAHVPSWVLQLVGKYLCYALLALAVDLVWGFCGILSLGHGAFFALGGYCMGMYLMRQIGSRGVYGNPILPDFMVFLNYKELPGSGTASTISGSQPSWSCWCRACLPSRWGGSRSAAASPASICRSSRRR